MKDVVERESPTDESELIKSIKKNLEIVASKEALTHLFDSLKERYCDILAWVVMGSRLKCNQFKVSFILNTIASELLIAYHLNCSSKLSGSIYYWANIIPVPGHLVTLKKKFTLNLRTPSIIMISSL